MKKDFSKKILKFSLMVFVVGFLFFAGAGKAEAAITYVGGQVGGFVGITTATTVTFSLTGGVASVPASGDLVVVSYTVGSTIDRALTIQNAGETNYILVGTELYQNDDFDVNLRVGYRFMPSVPETTVILSGTGSANDAGRYTIHVFRGVDSTTPLDVAAVTAGAIDTRVANPPAITPTTAGAWVYATGAGASATGGTYTSSNLTAFLAGTTADTNDAQIGSGYFVWSSGAFDPAAFGGGGVTLSSDSWAAVTLAIRPAVAPTITTPTQTSITTTGATLGGNITSDGGSAITGRGVCYSTSANPTTPCTTTTGTTGVFTVSATGLTGNTTYNYRAYAINAIGTIYTTNTTFLTMPGAPGTPTYTSVTSTGMTANWTAPTGGVASYSVFYCVGAGCTATFTTVATGISSAAVSQAITSLTCGTTYRVRVTGVNATGSTDSALGANQATSACLAPTITTPTKTSITTTTALLGGNVTSNGGSAVTGRGVCVGASANPALGGNCFTTTGTTGIFTVSATGLTPNTLYNYSAYATNSVGTSYTTNDTFTTLSPPTVTTNAVTASPTQTTATINGTANPNGYTTTGWFRYATVNPGTCTDTTTWGGTSNTRAPISEGTGLGSGSTGVAYNRMLTDLTPGIPYWVCAIASNTNGTGVGSPVRFDTTAGIPTSVTVSTGAALHSTAGSYYVTLNGSANPNNLDSISNNNSFGFFRLYTLNPGSCTNSGGDKYPALEGNDKPLGNGSTSQNFSFNLVVEADVSLIPQTPYWYCAFARNMHGTVASGTVVSFTTDDGATDPCDPPSGGNHTLIGSCSYSNSSSVGGADAGTGTANTGVLTISSPNRMTINAGQSVAWGSISKPTGASIHLAPGGALRKAAIWVTDADEDGYVGSTIQEVSTTKPLGKVRRNSVSTNYNYFSKMLVATTNTDAPYILDCNDSSATAYRNVPDLVKDADNDGYKTSAVAATQCVGASATFNGRLYYNDGSGSN